MKADSAFFDLAAGGMKVDFERVVGKLKPGAHLLALSPIATHHSNTIGIEDAGMEIRDTIAWVFDSGEQTPDMVLVTVARKPLEGTVAENTLKYGTGGLNIDGCRVAGKPWTAHRATGLGSVKFFSEGDTPVIDKAPHDAGRWPANLLHDNSPAVVAMFPDAKGGCGNGNAAPGVPGSVTPLRRGNLIPRNDSGSAARFFYSVPHLDDLLKYLLKLITPPGGTVLTDCNNILAQSAYPSVKYHED